MVLKASWVSRQKVEMERRIKKSEPNATYCREREREREREVSQVAHQTFFMCFYSDNFTASHTFVWPVLVTVINILLFM